MNPFGLSGTPLSQSESEMIEEAEKVHRLACLEVRGGNHLAAYSAELPGFQTKAYTEVRLGNADKIRLNFALQVATQAQSVEVTVAADTLLATSSSSVGEILSSAVCRDEPPSRRVVPHHGDRSRPAP